MAALHAVGDRVAVEKWGTPHYGTVRAAGTSITGDRVYWIVLDMGLVALKTDEGIIDTRGTEEAMDTALVPETVRIARGEGL